MDFMIARVRAKLPANIYIFGCRFLRRRRVGALLRNITFLRVRDMWIEEEGLSTCQKRTFQHLGESVRLFFSFIWRHRSEHQPTDLRCKRKAFFFSGPVVLLLPFNRTMHPGRRSFKIWKLDRIPDLPPEMGCVAWATVAALDATTKRVVRRNRRRLRRLGRLLSTQKKRRKLHYQFILHGNMRHNSFHQTARQVIYGEPLEIIISLDQQSSR